MSKRCEGSYTSRKTEWRRSRHQGDCNCEHHGSLQEPCDCGYHDLDSDSSSDCGCPYHSDEQNAFNIYFQSPNPSDDNASTNVNEDIHLSVLSEAAELSVSCAIQTSLLGDKQDWSVLLTGSNDDKERAIAPDCSSHNTSRIEIPDAETVQNLSNSTQICRLDRFRNEDSYYNSDAEDGDSDESDQSSDSSSDSRESHESDDSPGGDSDPGGAGGVDQPENLDDADEANFSLAHDSLNRIIQAAEGRTAREMLAMTITLAVRHNLNYMTLIELCKIINVACAFKVLPSTKKQLWSVLQKRNAGIRKIAFCPKCFATLGEVRNLPRNVACITPACDYQCRRRMVKYFITLSIKKQLKNLLSLPGIWEHLQYKAHRQKLNADAYEDVLDGDGYRALEEIENGLRFPFNFSFQTNTDGFKLGKGSTQAFPLLLRINELPPSLRQKFTLLAGLIIYEGEPNMNMFLEPLVLELNDLSTNGIEWSPREGEIITSRFYSTCFCLDARARAAALNLNLYNGNCSCPFCYHPGIKVEGSMKFPIPGTEVVRIRRGVQEVVVIPETPLRTHEEILNDMIEAEENQRTVNGFHGVSILSTLQNVDLSRCCSPDDLHPIYLGATKYLTNLIIEGLEDADNLIRQIDERLLRIHTPTHISRKPKSLRKRAKWKGTEWRNWLLYYGVPCMIGIVPNNRLNLFSLLSKAVYLLSQDSITNENIEESQRCLDRFEATCQEIFGIGSMRFNIHILKHLPRAVRTWGPLQLHSTSPYESWNARLGKFVSSPWGASDQIINRYLLVSLARMLPYEPGLEEEVREEILSIMSTFTMDNPLQIGNVHFFGQRTLRNPLGEEVLLLNNANVPENIIIDFTEYLQCRKSRMLLQSQQYRIEAGERDSKSDNSIIVTNDGQFCSIDSIVVFGEGEHQMSGLLCHLLSVRGVLQQASHIKCVVNENQRLFVPMANVRKPAIRIMVRNMRFVAAMSNVGEID